MHDTVVNPSFRPSGHTHQQCVDEALCAAEEVCASRGLRLTPLRRRVLELVWAQHEPVGAYELLDALRAERGSAAPPTIYRALEFLLNNGLVHRIESLSAFVGCGAPGKSHTGQFLICESCGTVGELNDREIEAILDRKAAEAGFSAVRQTIEIVGRCPGCREDDGS